MIFTREYIDSYLFLSIHCKAKKPDKYGKINHRESWREMSYLNNAFKVIKLLREHEVMKADEIGKEIGCTGCMVRKYVKQINLETDINIISKPGSNGGYCIEDVILTDNEKLAIYEAVKLLKMNNFRYINDLESAYEKIKIIKNVDLARKENLNEEDSISLKNYLDKNKILRQFLNADEKKSYELLSKNTHERFTLNELKFLYVYILKNTRIPKYKNKQELFEILTSMIYLRVYCKICLTI